MPTNIIGNRYGRLTVTGNSTRKKHVECLCDCGIRKTVQRSNLFSGGTVSCGCYHHDVITTHGQSVPTDGRSHGLTYSSWMKMKARCLNRNHVVYHRYGGRGITICDRWMTFENFLADMGERPSQRHSIDRIDGLGNYEPGNCKWSTPAEQNRNKSTNRMLTHDGVTMCCADWADRIGISRALLCTRLNRGWSVSEAITGKRNSSFPSEAVARSHRGAVGAESTKGNS